jgi:hypothetical protein
VIGCHAESDEVQMRSIPMKYILLVVALGCLVTCAQGWGKNQEQKADDPKVLTNKDVVDMLSSGLPADIVAAKVKTSKCNFDTSVPALNTLRSDKVPDAVILAMVEAPHFTPVGDDGRTRAFVTDSQSWETYGYARPRMLQAVTLRTETNENLLDGRYGKRQLS